MKKIVHTSAILVTLAGSIATGPSSLQACGTSILDWIANNPQEIGLLEASAAGEFAAVIQSLNAMYVANPAAFVQLVTLCTQFAGGPIPADLLIILKQYNLINQNDQLSDLVQDAITWAVQLNDNGTVTIASLNSLVQSGSVSLVVSGSPA